MQKVIIIKSKDGFAIAEMSNYTYASIETAVAFARDKWGDDAPAMAVAVDNALPYVCLECGTTDPTSHVGGYPAHAQ